ncbi:oxidoreductase [Salmonella enterica subsp. enterica serovar Enteritidis]|nr:oxidoreductase [Salmonella enterica subsp. enterica serovar Enteritidis]
MLSMPPYLPFSGDWRTFIDDVYNAFKQDILLSNIRFKGLPVRPRYTPEYDGKEFGFWHVTSEGKEENERTPDLERCKRIRWIAHMINNYNHAEISCWSERRDSTEEWVIWNEYEDYVVVLSARRDYWLLKTAYLVTYNSKKRSLQQSRKRSLGI